MADTNTPPNIDINAPYTPKRPTPIVSISINHPIATAFKKIKNFLTHKQTLFSTSFTIKVTPIVALVSLFGVTALFGGGITTAFNFGKEVESRFISSLPTPTPKVIIVSPTIAPIMVSREGTIKATYQLQPTPSKSSPLGQGSEGQAGPTALPIENIFISPDASISATPTLTPTLSPTPPTLHYLLVSRSGSILFLNTTSGVHLQNYVGLHVLVSGTLDTTKSKLIISKQDAIEILQ
ncbi:MAG TPA: hypothetical protein VLG12_04785 [Candidatus Saccharimonadales bacterium]|nr:hypothetical protein [Candidatus Saccharimonadales bacterium]